MKKCKTCGIYGIKNKLNDKIYVGSSIDIYLRWNVHKHSLRKNKHHSFLLQEDWNFYGEDDFEFIVLEIVSNLENHNKNLRELEQCWINKFNKFKLYNIVPVVNCDDSICDNITNEHRTKMTLAQKSRPIYQIDLFGNIVGEWYGARTAAKKLNLIQTSIQRCCKKAHKIYAGFIWIYKSDYNKDMFDILLYLNESRYRPVLQCDMSKNEIIKLWNGATECSKILNIDAKSILRCCNKQIGSTKGFRWMYLKDYISNGKILEFKSPKIKQVLQIDDFGNIINKYNSISEAARKYEINESTLRHNIQKYKNKLFDTYWVFAIDYYSN